MSRDLPSSPFLLLLGATDEKAHLDEETTTLFRAYASRLMRHLRRHFGEEVARDASQEAFLRLYRVRSGGTRIDNPEAWLTCVAHHAAIDEVRQSRREVPVTGEARELVDAREEPSGTPEQRCAQRQQLARLKHLITNLPDVERECLLMRAEGETFQAIGRQVGMDYRRVAELLQRVIKGLQAP